MKRSWIKLYVEVLDDVKLGPLPVDLRWRFIELLLVAAESDEGGILPTSKRLAWRLRLDQAQLLDDLRAMSEAGIVCRQGECWKVTNFEKRQASLTEAERASGYRSRKKQGSVAAAVTESDAAAVTDSSSVSPGGESAERGGRFDPAQHERFDAVQAEGEDRLAAEREAYDELERNAVPPPPDYAEQRARMQAAWAKKAGRT